MTERAQAAAGAEVDSRSGAVIRTPAGPDEWGDYFALRWRLLRAPWGQPPGSERDQREKFALHLLAEVDGRLVGVGRIHPLADDCWQVRYMAVRPEYQGRGIGRAILARLHEHARAKGGRWVVLNAREESVAFYRKAGYEVVGDGHVLFGEIRHVKMLRVVGGEDRGSRPGA